ncbi:MAG: HupE/UreJ family protein [Ferruginibacter sp.]
MSDFAFYFSTGWHHIISRNALDHQLFILALTAIYLSANWKQAFVLATAFTIGHSLTLALSVYDITRFDTKWVEFFIPLTIIATAVSNLRLKDLTQPSLRINYPLGLVFGLIHGMGFANTLRFMLAKDQSIAIPLISFNIGLEVGQLIIVAFILLAGHIAVTRFKLNRKWWVRILSGIAIIIAVLMAKERWPL